MAILLFSLTCVKTHVSDVLKLKFFFFEFGVGEEVSADSLSPGANSNLVKVLLRNLAYFKNVLVNLVSLAQQGLKVQWQQS